MKNGFISDQSHNNNRQIETIRGIINLDDNNI